MDKTPSLAAAIAALTPRQQRFVSRIVGALTAEVRIQRDPSSDIATDDFCEAMADTLRGHHVSATGYLGKLQFEKALGEILLEQGHAADLSPANHPGADITIDGVPWSLKTQGDATIKTDEVFISKMMELGHGAWVTEADLGGLRDQFLNHLAGYERIFTMRYLSGHKSRVGRGDHEYELVEIPKALLLAAAGQPCTFSPRSKATPRTGICQVHDSAGKLAFMLYFDGGGERKLQIQKLRKDFCQVHASWLFREP